MKKTTVALCVIALLGVYYSAWPRTVTVVVGRGATSSAVTRSDTFTGEESPLATNWTTITDFAAMQKTNGYATASTNDNWDYAAYWDADSFAADQFSQAKATGVSVGVTVRVTGGACYLFRQSSTAGTFQLYKMPGWNLMGDAYTGVSFTDGQVIRLEATGTSTTTLTPIVNSVALATRTDSSSPLESGGVGIYAVGLNTSQLDDWSGGEL